MNPTDLQVFAARYLEPRLPWLTRRDRTWTEPSDDSFVCPVEFVATPIEWIKCSLTLVAPPAKLGRERYTLVGMRFVALWRPEAEDLDVGVNHGHGMLGRFGTFKHRWKMGRNSGDALADELAAAAREQWPATADVNGTLEGYAQAIAPFTKPADSWVNFTGPSTRPDVGWLETLAYANLLLGDPATAHECVVRLRSRDLDGTVVARANRLDHQMTANPAAAVDQLYEWRRERLEAEGLLDLAAPRGFAAARRQAAPTPES